MLTIIRTATAVLEATASLLTHYTALPCKHTTITLATTDCDCYCRFDDSLCQESWQLAAAWLNCTSDSPSPENTEQSQFANWPSPQRVLFLEKLLDSCKGSSDAVSSGSGSDKLTLPVLQALDKCYELTESKNAEVRYRWQLLCLKQGAQFIVPHVIDFVTSQVNCSSS
jgi:Leukotriene A4 hydrolase, C-terminal